MPNILISNNFYQGTSQACIIDLTPPTFAGITFLDVESRGQIRAGWSAASDATAPIRYEVYIKASTATGLFSTTNIIAVTPNLLYDIFTLPDGSFLQNGTTYFVGIRAIDGVNNRDSNTVSMDVISTGVLTAIDVYETKGAFSLAPDGMFQGTIWGNKNSSLATTSSSALGTASYTVYDKLGNVVSGLSESGITADSNSQFKITPVIADLSEQLDHYVIKVSITMDSEVRTNYVSMVQKIPSYAIKSQHDFNSGNNFIAKFWAEEETGTHVSDVGRLGSASYQVLDASGVVVAAFTQTGLSPASNGIYSISPVSGLDTSTIHLYTAKIIISVDGKNREALIPLTNAQEIASCKAQFSINALDQFRATLWLQSNSKDSKVVTSGLGTASYTVYDASGTAVAGLSQSGISADGNGRFQITPVSAALLTDLTHYNVKIAINYNGFEHVAYKGFSLLGT